MATTRSPRLGGSRRELCNLQRLNATKSDLRFDFEGGSIETWDVNDHQFKCVGVVPSKITMQPNSLTLPNYHLFPRLIFILEGEGIIRVDFPGCPETFDTRLQQQEQQETKDSHQRVHRFVRGGFSNHHVQARQERPLDESRFNFDNIFAGFNTELLAEAFNIEPRIVRTMQECSANGIIVKNALLSPHLLINSHTIIYVLSGEAQLFATTAKAGQNGFEWVAFKTNKSPMKSPVAGYTSVFRAMPLEVITNAYNVSLSQVLRENTNAYNSSAASRLRMQIT
ncbi:11S globulin seed storage protein 2-like protein [Tanacetum coccineum]